MFADRLGKSKSWVDKVERGVRSLDKVSTLQEIAAVLRIDAAVLLARDARPAGVVERGEGVERIRAALSTYEILLGRPRAGLSAERVDGASRTPGPLSSTPAIRNWSSCCRACWPKWSVRTPASRGRRLAGRGVPGHGRAAGQAGRGRAGVAGRRPGDDRRDR